MRVIANDFEPRHSKFLNTAYYNDAELNQVVYTYHNMAVVVTARTDAMFWFGHSYISSGWWLEIRGVRLKYLNQ